MKIFQWFQSETFDCSSIDLPVVPGTIDFPEENWIMDPFCNGTAPIFLHSRLPANFSGWKSQASPKTAESARFGSEARSSNFRSKLTYKVNKKAIFMIGLKVGESLISKLVDLVPVYWPFLQIEHWTVA